MSKKAINIVLKSSLARNERLVLLAYVYYADSKGEKIFPSVEKIALKTGYSERQVQRITRLLTGKGILVECGKSKRDTNLYKINFDSIPNSSAQKTQGGQHAE